MSNSELFELPKMYFVYLATVFILLIHLKNYLRGSKPLFFRSPLLLPLFLFFLSQLISTVFSIDRHTSFFGYYSRLNGGLLPIITYSILALIVPLYLPQTSKNKLINISLISGILVSLYAILEHFGIDKNLWVQDVQSRVFSTLGQPNWLAAYLCILLPLAIDNFLKSKTKLIFLVYGLVFSVYFLALLFTKSKSGLIAAAISLGIYFFIKFFQKSNRLILVSCFLFLVSLSLLITNPVKDYFFPPQLKIENLKVENLNITPSEDIRKIVWQGALQLWQQFPLIGTGPETFAYSYYWTRPASHNLTSEWDFLYNKAHNEYLNYLATTGLFGLTTYLLLIAFSIYFLLKNRQFAFLSAYISILFTNFFGFSVVVVSLFFFLLPFLGFPQPQFASVKSKKFPFIVPLFIGLFLILKIVEFFIADLTYAKAVTLDTAQQYQSAADLLQVSLKFRPNEPTYLIKYGEIYSKIALTQKSKDYVDLAISATDKALYLSPFNLNFWKQRAQVYYYLSALDSQYYLKALDSLHQAEKLAPTDAKTFYMLGEFYKNIKETDASIIYYQKALALKPNYDHAAFALGQIYFDQKDFTKARQMFNLVLSLTPQNQDAQDYLQRIPTP